MERLFDLAYAWNWGPADLAGLPLSMLPLWEAQTDRIGKEIEKLRRG